MEGARIPGACQGGDDQRYHGRCGTLCRRAKRRRPAPVVAHSAAMSTSGSLNQPGAALEYQMQEVGCVILSLHKSVRNV